jgi:hypothetical protein
MYIRHNTFMWLLSCTCIAECRYNWATSVLLLLMWIGPPSLHAQGIPTTLPSSEETVTRRSLFGLAALDLGAWSKVPSSRMCTHTVINTITSTKRQQHNIHEFNTLILFYSRELVGAAGLNTSVWNSNISDQKVLYNLFVADLKVFFVITL